MAHRTEIMWIERKPDGVVGPARIGRVTYSKSGRSLSYGEQRFESLKRKGFKAEIDDDVRREYWTKIRNQPENSHISKLKVPGKYPG
jgi:hypothetical protein